MLAFYTNCVKLFPSIGYIWEHNTKLRVMIPLMAVSAAMGLAGAIGQSFANAKAQKIQQENYQNSKASLLTDLYTSPLDSVSNQALLRQMDERIAKNNEAIANNAVAGNATFENTLAAKQAGNEAISNAYSGLLQAEDQRRKGVKNQLLALDSQKAQADIAAARANGEAWNSWGSTLASGMLDYDTAYMEKYGKAASLGNLFRG